jgi:hypothetical protein
MGVPDETGRRGGRTLTTAMLVESAIQAGLTLEPGDDGKLAVRGPAPLPSELIQELSARKAEVIDHLTQPGGIGVARPPLPHRQCRICGGGLQPEDADGSWCFTCNYHHPQRVQ